MQQNMEISQKKVQTVLYYQKKMYFCTRNPQRCPDGGIGRRAGLKHQWSNPCRFDPGSGYSGSKNPN